MITPRVRKCFDSVQDIDSSVATRILCHLWQNILLPTMFFSSKVVITSICFTSSSPLLRDTPKYFFLFWSKCAPRSVEPSLIQVVLFVFTHLPFKKKNNSPTHVHRYSRYFSIGLCITVSWAAVINILVLETQLLVVVAGSVIDRALGSNEISQFGIWDSRSGSYDISCWPVTFSYIPFPCLGHFDTAF